jgi:hypothetical protein
VGGAAAAEWTEAEVMARALSASLAGNTLRHHDHGRPFHI